MAKSRIQEWLTEDKLLLLESWARNGLTDEQIATNMGICTATFYTWKAKHSEISEALKKGKEVVDIQVENALLKRALGYKYTETTKETKWNPKTEQFELIVTKTVEKEVVADTTAQIFWLKNRRPRDWRDKKDVALEGEVKTGNPFEGLTTDELRKLINSE